MTPFSILVRRCGLTHQEVAEYLYVSLDAVRSWSAGRRGVPVENLYKLARLCDALPPPAEILPVVAGSVATFVVPPTNSAAKELGYPAVGDVELALGPAVARQILDGRTVALVNATGMGDGERKLASDREENRSPS
jgi:hypothetical protein